MITLILADSALEVVPSKLWNHKIIVAHAKRLHKKPNEMLLDSSYHYRAMKDIKDLERRGRPDIIHFCLLEALGSPLNLNKFLRIFIHTINNDIIKVEPHARLPRNYDRFKGLMEQLLTKGTLMSEQKLLHLYRNQSVKSLIKSLHCSNIIGFSVIGKSARLPDVFKDLNIIENDVAVVIGGFPVGHFSSETKSTLDSLYSIYSKPLEAWVVVSRILAECERLLEII